MKFATLKETVIRTAKMSGLKLKKYSPEILTGVAIVSGIAATATAIERTLKIDDILAEIEHDQEKLHQMEDYMEQGVVTEEQYTQTQLKQAKVVYGAKAAIKLVNHYRVPMALTIVSVGSALGAYGIMSKRVAGLTEAYMATLAAYETYRHEVEEKFGPDAEKEILADVLDHIEEQKKINDQYEEETGKKAASKATAAGMSIYARWFDEASIYWRKSPGYNASFVRSQERYWNQRLRIDGHVFLNQVYESLGIPHSTAGAVVGWVYNPYADEGTQIDFGLLNGDIEAYRDFVNGRERSVLLDFNVDGVIYDMI